MILETARELVRRVFSTCVGSLVESDLESIAIDSCGEKTWTGRVILLPEDVEFFAQFLRQLLYKDRGMLTFTFGKQVATLDLFRVEFPGTFQFVSIARQVRVYDYPPRSRLHNLPLCSGIAERLRETHFDTCNMFMPEDDTFVYGVSPSFTKNGRSYRAPLLAIIPPDLQFLFAAVARFKRADADAPVFHLSRSYVDQEKFHVEAKYFRSDGMKEIDAKVLQDIFCATAQPLVDHLKNWTKSQITDVQRSASLQSCLTALLAATTAKK